jgi:uncharacterized protein with NRDE domain
MCLILAAWHVHPDFPLVIAANRDEFHARRAAPAQWWADRPQILAGRDLEANGTWLGVTRSGQIAALTNFRDPGQNNPGAPSRGGLVVGALESIAPITERLARLGETSREYNGFSMMCADGRQLGIFESVPGSGRTLEPGIYGLSNHLLDTPWPKVQRAKSHLATALGTLPDDGALLDLLRDDRTAPDPELPRTGVSIGWERLLSSAFIRGIEYGTRCSTVILVGLNGSVEFHEWTWQASGDLSGEVRHQFPISVVGGTGIEPVTPAV